MSTPTARDLEALMALFEGSDWKELDLRMDGFELYLSKNPSRGRSALPERAGRAVRADSGSRVPTDPLAEKVRSGPAPPCEEAPGVAEHWVAVRAPNLGTFYRAPKPGAAPYVELGQKVTPDTEVCLIEVMKLFTSVRAGVAGTVRRIVVQDADMVEHEQVLLYIEPA